MHSELVFLPEAVSEWKKLDEFVHLEVVTVLVVGKREHDAGYQAAFQS